MLSRSSREKTQPEATFLQDRGKDFFWFCLVVLVVASFWELTWDTQPYLSSDDMGKDLYPFEMALRGQWPCRDYYWQYGPVMLFYYSFWLAVGGIHLLSIRTAYAMLYFFSSILSYRSLRLFVSPPIAFLASLGFLIQGMVYPFHNFNHIGALPFLLLSIFFLWKFFREGKVSYCYLGTFALIGMALVKWNVGVTSFFAFLASLLFLKGFPKKRHSLLLFLIFIATVFGVYLVQYGGYRQTWVKQCLTFSSQTVPVAKSFVGQTLEVANPWISFKHLIQWFLVWDRKRLWWLALFLVFGILGFLGFKKRNLTGEERKVFRSATVSLFLFGIFNSADFFVGSHIYRFDFWSFPILVLLMGLMAESAKFLFARQVRILLGGWILVGVLALPLRSVKEAFAARVPERFLDFPRGRIYIVKESLSTVEVFKKGTHFILENTQPAQEILTLPKEPLYCFLSDRRHATREINFEISVPIPEEEEEELIHRLEAKQVPLVLLSNRDDSNPLAMAKGEMGYFGKTHLKKLGKYIFEHYREVQAFGAWRAKKPRIDHAIKIFRKKGGS